MGEDDMTLEQQRLLEVSALILPGFISSERHSVYSKETPMMYSADQRMIDVDSVIRYAKELIKQVKAEPQHVQDLAQTESSE